MSPHQVFDAPEYSLHRKSRLRPGFVPFIYNFLINEFPSQPLKTPRGVLCASSRLLGDTAGVFHCVADVILTGPVLEAGSEACR